MSLIIIFRLPQDMYQTAKVAKVLLLMEKGKGNQFRGKKLNEIDIKNEIYYSSESEDDDEPNLQRILRKQSGLNESELNNKLLAKNDTSAFEERNPILNEQHEGSVTGTGNIVHNALTREPIRKKRKGKSYQ